MPCIIDPQPIMTGLWYGFLYVATAVAVFVLADAAWRLWWGTSHRP